MDDAAHAAAIFALDPAAIGGVVLRGGPGPVRDSWLSALRALIAEAPLRRIPANVPDDRLLGGLDLAATLATGRPVAERGILAAADGGVIILAMAERLPAGTAARIGATLDHQRVSVERDGFALDAPARFGAVALDEGEEGECAPVAISDRLAIHLTLDTLTEFPDVELDAAWLLLAQSEDEPAIIEALCGAAMALGIASLRAPILALRVARAAAALGGRARIAEEDAALAARLVLAPRATRIPEAPAENEPEPPPPAPPQDADENPATPPPDQPESDAPPPDRTQAMQDMILAAASAALPANLLARLGAQMASRARQGAAGKSGAQRMEKQRGRVIGTRAGEPRGGARIGVLATLRSAAPWQRLRGAAPGRIAVRREDFRILRFRQRSETTTIFAVDASGSAALNRLAEAKGAVELLLADCYVRRDRVALITFRGTQASLALPPTRSLTRARRALSGLPGGGGTPLATAMDEAMTLAEAERRGGRTPVIVILTDGRANIARDGSAGRPKAEADALDAARPLRAAGIATLLVDTAPRPQEFCRRLAAASGARLVPLPQANSTSLNRAVQAATA
ncbi:magnesium chelatase subunit D [Plastoroseomonas arctica]|uniref:Magnesium chelatase subunit D n=1 Tax=Plastoroseomonas arctica TaxID=1509237 RepID=A0AAF1JXU7_9PROT|nr:magnesium chelatase subunit D [Plastoroseomonas arctica]MBR0654488.1 magnesium chelatase subunit D [Plastoroseomonas arctica]